MKNISRALLIILFTTTAAFAQTKAADHGWPRKFAIGNNSVAVYQPQIEDWTGNSFAARAAIAITENSSKQPLYGVLWFTARAEIDKINRLVTLSDSKSKRSVFHSRQKKRRPLKLHYRHAPPSRTK